MRAHFADVLEALSRKGHQVLADLDVNLPLHLAVTGAEQLKVVKQSSAHGILDSHHSSVCLAFSQGPVQVLEGIAFLDIQGCIIKKTGCLFVKAALESLYGDAHAKGP